MKNKKILDAVSGISEKYIDEAAPGGRRTYRGVFAKIAAVAACFCIIAGVSLSLSYFLKEPLDHGKVTGTLSGNSVETGYDIGTLNNDDKTDTVGNSEDNTHDTSSETEINNELKIIEVPLKTAMGENTTVSEEKLPTDILSLESVKESYPVYICKYPVSATEGFQFDIGDEEMTLMNKKLDDFLPLLYSENEISSLPEREYNDINYSISIYDGDIHIMATVNGISIAVDNYSISDNVIKNNAFDDTYLNAVFRYMGFENIDCETINSVYYTPSINYQILNADADLDKEPEYNRFKYISLKVYEDSQKTLITVYDIDYSPEKAKEYKTISYDVVKEYISKTYPDIDLDNIKVTMTYSTDAVKGYYTPCYRLYMGNTDETGTLYTVTDIVMVDLDRYAE